MKLFRRLTISFLLLLLIVPLTYRIALFLKPKLTIWHPYETRLLDEKGTNGVTLLDGKPEDYVTLSEIPLKYRDCLIGLEDQRFYQHRGIDYKRTIKSFIDNTLNQRIVSGGSTITQQLARLLFLSNEKTYKRKLREYSYAKRLEDSLTKDEILEIYLNTVYFGRDLYGIGNATRYYFSKGIEDLKLNEAIALFSILKSPNSLGPANSPEAFYDSYHQALMALFQRDVIESSEYYLLYKDLPTIDIDDSYHSNSLKDPYSGITKELQRLKLDSKTIGNTIHTTIDYELQNDLVEIIESHKNNESKENVAVVVMRPKDGAVISLIGGYQDSDNSFNRAIDGSIEIGSTIKPILYTIALEKGFTPLTSIRSEPTTFHIDGIGDYSPENSSGTYAHRNINMVEALALSDNIYATKTTLLIGSNALANRLKLIGINSVNDDVTNGLGSLSLSPLVLTSIYNALANRGVYHKPYFITKVKQKDEVIYTKSLGTGMRLFAKDKSLIMSHLLLAPYDKALETYTSPTMLNYEPSKRFSVKTGTSQRASVIMAYNPNYTLGIYVGTDTLEGEYDRTLAKRLFLPLTTRLMRDKKDSFYESNNLKPFTLTNSVTGALSKTYYR